MTHHTLHKIMTKKTTIGIVGGGNMGSAIVSGIRGTFSVRVCEKDALRAGRLRKKFRIAVQDLKTVVENSDAVILAVKPQDFESVLGEIRPLLTHQLVISIAAGITTLYIEKRLREKTRVVRAMPNLPASVGQGMTALCKGRWANAADIKLSRKIFENIGRVIEVQEKWMDAVTAVSGSGPAYVFLFVECFMKAARSLGFSDEMSKTLVMQTLKGSLNLLENRKEDAATLRAAVTSKGGTTQAALEVFSAHHFEEIFKKALLAARNRAKELAKK